jgi:uncharacterized membrane protein YesL
MLALAFTYVLYMLLTYGNKIIQYLYTGNTTCTLKVDFSSATRAPETLSSSNFQNYLPPPECSFSVCPATVAILGYARRLRYTNTNFAVFRMCARSLLVKFVAPFLGG